MNEEYLDHLQPKNNARHKKNYIIVKLNIIYFAQILKF